MNHAAAFTAARDALSVLLARPELLGHDAAPLHIDHALELLEQAGEYVIGGDRRELPALSEAEMFQVLPVARAALTRYAARELPTWGSAEGGELLAALGYASQMLGMLSALNTMLAQGKGGQA